MKLDQIQVACYDKLSKTKVGALFMDAGSGKTFVAYSLIESVKEVDFILYIAPYQTIHNEITTENVVTEVTKYGGFTAEHEFVGIESIQGSDRIYLNLINRLQRYNCVFIVMDESIKIKNSDTKRFKRLMELAKLSTYRLILNGTPITRNLLDVWSQMYFLSPLILNMNEAEFKNTFVNYTVMTKGNIRREWINRYSNLDVLYELIEPFVFEAGYQLEAKISFINISYNLSKESREEYTFLKEKYLNDETLEAKNNNIFLELTQKMQHIYSCEIEKIELLKTIIAKNPNEKILVVRKFISATAFIESQIENENVKVISYGKHSYGLNLQQYSIMVIWDKTFDYGMYYQILKRIHRKGQDKDCRVFVMNANTPLDEMMDKNIEKKGKLLEAFKKKSVIEKIKML